MANMKYKCIIFDCDGVLVDSEVLANQVLVDMVKALGFNIELKFALKHFTGRSLMVCMEIIERKIDKKLPNGFVDQYRQNSYQVFGDHLQPIKGVHNLLSKLHIPYCVASSGPLEKVKRNLTTVGLAEKFTGRMFSSYEIESWKPEPDIFLHAAKQMGFMPNDCIVIEDSLVGVEAAKTGGFDVMVYVPDGQENVFKNMGVTIFSDMGALGRLS